MTKDEIMRMARKAGMPDPMVFIGAYERFASLIAAAEREQWPASILAERIRARATPMIKLNTDKSAAVNQSLTWLSIDDHPPPVGAKLLLINRANGVAVLGIYQAKHQWTHWQGLPKFSEEQK